MVLLGFLDLELNSLSTKCSASFLLYNIFFHPLAQIPGPLWWRASRLAFLRSFLAGNLVRDVRKIHEKYGDVVRIAPDEISFAREDVWADALSGRSPLPRNAIFFKIPPGQPDNLVMTADPNASMRMRQIVSPAFTERALSRQEPRIQFYVNLLMQRLQGHTVAQSDVTQEAVVDLVDWLHWFAFDLVGELAFGESFGCLQEMKHHQWIRTIFSSIKVSAFAATTRYYYGLETLLMQLIPRSILKMQDDHFAFAKARVDQRMILSQRDDFMTPMLEDNPNFEKISIPEIQSTMAVLILAGSETTATALCGILNSLVQNPEQLHRLEKEIRSTFGTEKEITLSALQKLPFLNAVILEGLRMCNPVVGGILRRVPKGGSMICGYFLPNGNPNTKKIPHKCYQGVHSQARGYHYLRERFLTIKQRKKQNSNFPPTSSLSGKNRRQLVGSMIRNLIEGTESRQPRRGSHTGISIPWSNILISKSLTSARRDAQFDVVAEYGIKQPPTRGEKERTEAKRSSSSLITYPDPQRQTETSHNHIHNPHHPNSTPRLSRPHMPATDQAPKSSVQSRTPCDALASALNTDVDHTSAGAIPHPLVLQTPRPEHCEGSCGITSLGIQVRT
ncbi:hypothetical protein GQX73_g6274 [Xylaria multiplex]|uniref:Cytochrome P450 n=1 Tax=Xylaria multiplex TaxID=323545 RepID=A0A7C8IZH5_9PEZI|nr:hypothetical protein GQX73_g6274 [Xylaria multiplex]